VLRQDATYCLGRAAKLDYLLELAAQICDIISLRRLLWFLNHGLLIGLRCLLAYDLHLVVSTAVIVPNLAADN
jgi:hypothetical protein